MIESATCDGEVEQDLFMDVYLEAGEYLLQIDGFGSSVGCGSLCVYNQGFLGTNVMEILDNRIKRTKLQTNKYDLIGRRTR